MPQGVRRSDQFEIESFLVRICVIISALNEEECIGRLVASLPRPLVSELVVVDNNPPDRTTELLVKAIKARVRIVQPSLVERDVRRGLVGRADAMRKLAADLLARSASTFSDEAWGADPAGEEHGYSKPYFWRNQRGNPAGFPAA